MSKLFKRKNSPYWWWTGRYKGARYRRSTKMIKERLAHKVKDHWDLNLMLDKLEFLGPSFNKSITIEKFIWNHLIFLSKRKSDDTVYTAKYVLGQFCSYCNSQKVKFINQITIKLIDGYIESLTCSPKTKKNYVGVISRMLNEAVKDDLIIKNPAKFATLPKIIPTNRHRLLEESDLKIIFGQNSPWETYYYFLLYTGLRAGDVALLCRDNINLKKGCIVSLVRKSRRTHEFPLADKLRALIPLDMSSKQPLFPQLYTTNDRKLNGRLAIPRKHLQLLLAAEDRPKATLHSFRHTFNTMLRDLGMSIEDRRVLLSHATSSVTKIYTHPNLEVAKELINKL